MNVIRSLVVFTLIYPLFSFLDVLVGSATDFKIDCRSLSKTGGDDRLKCIMREPSGKYVNVPVKDKFDGTYIVTYEPRDEGFFSRQSLIIFGESYKLLRHFFRIVQFRSFI